jgi:phage-related protein
MAAIHHATHLARLRVLCGWERREEEVSYIGMLVDANRSTQSGSPLTTCDQCVPDCQVLCSG